MPVYEFKCGKCDSEFTKLIGHKDIPNVTCSFCHSRMVNQKFGLFSAHFKGKGFYKTDNPRSK